MTRSEPYENGVGAAVFHLGDLEHSGAGVEDWDGIPCKNRTCNMSVSNVDVCCLDKDLLAAIFIIHVPQLS